MTNLSTNRQVRIPITKPLFDQRERDLLDSVLQSGWVVQGPMVAEFERMFADYVGTENAIATTSCTSALHLALLGAGIGPGDEVIVPAFTFVATANAVEYCGARPAFIDINLDTFTIDCQKLRQYLQSHKRGLASRPRCIVPVSLFGLCCDMDQINAIAEEFHLIVIEDAACAVGAVRHGRHAGTEALAGCFSFHPRKAITTGEGGMVVTNDEQMANLIRRLRDHGASKTDLERHVADGGSLLPEFNTLGYNYRMTDLQGALGVAQMAKLEKILDDRRQAAHEYNKILERVPFLRRPSEPTGCSHAFQSYVCLYLPDSAWQRYNNEIQWPVVLDYNRQRNQLMAKLGSDGIAVRQGTHAVHSLGYFQARYGLRDHDYPNAFLADRLSITLPLYSGITYPEQEQVVESIETAAATLESRSPASPA